MSNATLRQVEPNPQHKRLYDAVVKVAAEEGKLLSAVEVLAIMSQIVGKLVALQDHRKMTAVMAMEVVARNIETGNMQAQLEIMSAPTGRPQ